MRWSFVKVAKPSQHTFCIGEEDLFFYKSMHVMDKTILRPKNVMTFISKIKNVIHEKRLDTITL